MSIVKDYLLPAAISLVFIAEGVFAGRVFTGTYEHRQVPPPQKIISELRTSSDHILNHMSWEIRDGIDATSPLGATIRLEHAEHLIEGAIETFLYGDGFDREPLAHDQDMKSFIDAPAFLALHNPPLPCADAKKRRGPILTWNSRTALCETTPSRMRFDVEKARRSTQEIFIANLFRKAAPFAKAIEHWSPRFHLPPDLIYAIAHTESNFNPNLISSRNAHGLMQVVPETAGYEVKQWLGGNSVPMGAELLDPFTNIKYGTGYLRILLQRYFHGITAPRSREYCAIAAYNCGSVPVLLAFAQNRRQAVTAINEMKADEVLNTLLDRLPMLETRLFVRRILTSRTYFTPEARRALLADQNNRP